MTNINQFLQMKQSKNLVTKLPFHFYKLLIASYPRNIMKLFAILDSDMDKVIKIDKMNCKKI